MGSFKIDQDAIEKLASILEKTGLTEIEYEESGSRIKISKNTSQNFSYAGQLGQSAVSDNLSDQKNTKDFSTVDAVKSPMVGTVYLAPEPNAPAFVKLGDSVSVGQVLLIIEAMKVMNPIKSTKSGKVTKIFIKDAEPVEFGTPLLVIE
jgi:acetyl-CoA carboxylase biotin carboxyl carrier protein